MYQKKAKMKQNKWLKGSRGITLIALVITIIVLLILAAVSIATLTGENGILTKAQTSKEKTEEEQLKEMVRTDILGYQAENKSGKVTAKQLKDVLDKYFESVPKEDELPNKLKEEDFKLKSNPEYGGQEIEIADIYSGGLTDKTEGTGGETFDPEELTIGVETAINTEKYGFKVTKYDVEYTTSGGWTSHDWRLFYQDEKYTYLITDELVGSYKPSDYYDNEEDTEKYKDGTKMSIVGQKLNGRVSTLFTDATNKANANIRATVWFTDITNELWTKYMDKKENGEKGDAEFCIASPTAELFEASYNKNTNPTHNAYKDNKLDVQLGTYGYSQNTKSNWLKKADSNGIYNKDDSYWWLASPGISNSSNCLFVDGNYRLFRRLPRVRQHV